MLSPGSGCFVANQEDNITIYITILNIQSYTIILLYEIQSGFLNVGHQWNGCHQKHENQEECIWNDVKYSFDRMLKISLRLGHNHKTI